MRRHFQFSKTTTAVLRVRAESEKINRFSIEAIQKLKFN